MSDDTKPGHRKLWCDLVDRGVRTAIASGKPVNVERILDSIGIFHWAPYRTQALEYAEKLLKASGGAA